MRQIHQASAKLFVDYAGQTVPIIQGDTDEVRLAQIFVAVPGASNYTFAEATWSQSLPGWVALPGRLSLSGAYPSCWHRLKNTAERYYILEGKGVVELGNLEPREVFVGGVVSIPPMTAQRIKNAGDIYLIFLAICTPGFKQENYKALEL